MSADTSTPTVRSTRPAFAFVALLGAATLLGASALFAGAAGAAASGPVGLGTAGSFAILAGAGITNTGPTTITGDVGTFPTTTRTGFSSVTLNGTDHGGDAVTQGAKDDLVTAYDDAAGRTPATPHATQLGGSTLLAGVYANPTFGITGTLTLDGAGVADSQWVFQMSETLITEVDSRVRLVNGANPCNVVWQVGSSATFKNRSAFAGDVLAYTSITAQGSATFRGRLLARNGAVTLDTNTVTNATCSASTDPGESASPSASSTPTASVAPTTAPPTTPPASAPATSPAAVPAAATTGSAGSGGTSGSTWRGTARDGGATTDRSGAVPMLPNTGPNTALALVGVALVAAGSAALLLGGPAYAGRHCGRRAT